MRYITGITCSIGILFSMVSTANAAFFDIAIFDAADVDNDAALGFAAPLRSQLGAILGNDCDDGSIGVSPYAAEIPGNFVDDNCAGGTDELVSSSLFMPDAIIDLVEGDEGADLQLDASSSTSANGVITQYHWFLDDSGQANFSTANSTDLYSWANMLALGYSPGTYDVGLVIQDSAGGLRSITSSFVISAVPVPTAFWLFASGLIGLIGVARRNK